MKFELIKIHEYAVYEYGGINENVNIIKRQKMTLKEAIYKLYLFPQFFENKQFKFE